METFKKHIVHLAKGGMGPVVAGSMGEAFSLADDERIALFKAAREALDEATLESSLICGTYVFLIMTCHLPDALLGLSQDLASSPGDRGNGQPAFAPHEAVMLRG